MIGMLLIGGMLLVILACLFWGSVQKDVRDYTRNRAGGTDPEYTDYRVKDGWDG